MQRVRIARGSRIRRFAGRPGAAVVGALGALAPAVALAEESASRTLDRPEDWGTVMLVTALGAVGLGVVYTVGYLYRRKRGLEWEFQKPDPPREHH